MEIIDAHAHIYPDKIAEKASKAVGDFYGIEMGYVGTVEGLLEEGKKAGVSRFLVHSVATTPHQVHSINTFINEQKTKHPELIGFITLHPDMTEEEIINEINYAIENNFKGIKLHPDFQKFFIDDPNVFKIYKNASGKLPILFHMGDKRYDYSSQERLVRVANEFKDLICIAAHFGGYSTWGNAREYLNLKYNNVYFDTSSSLYFLEQYKANQLIKMFGVDKFFFGTDYPMWDATEELERFNALDLTEEEKKKILGLNIKKLLNL